MKILSLFKIRKPKLHKGKRMRATVARRPLRIAATANYDEMAEPNMKLSRALLIVLLLHVVAVSGIIAFNAIKTRQGGAAPQLTRASAKPALPAGANDGVSTSPNEDAKAARPSGKQSPDHKAERARSGSRVEDSGKVYVVAKGDSPVSIAKKFKVSYDDLLALNHIDDPRKLRIGQKLLIPRKNSKGKKSDE